MTLKRGKRGGKRTVINGITFPSKLEAARYEYLLELEQTGEIENLRLQVGFLLLPSFTFQGKKIREMHYYSDFMYEFENTEYIEDTKAKYFQDPVYKLKKKLLCNLLSETDYLFYEVYEPTIHPSHLGEQNSPPRRKAKSNSSKNSASGRATGGDGVFSGAEQPRGRGRAGDAKRTAKKTSHKKQGKSSTIKSYQQDDES